jgi:serine/threonine protein phosphatase PrpC
VPEGGYSSSGSCLVAAVYDSRSGELVVANLGDSRAVLALPPCSAVGAGEAEEAEGVAVALTRDQTAANPLEWTRITALGATVDERGYIQGEMTPSRAVGDVQFKVRA